MTRASDIEPRVARFLWEERIADEMLNLVAGRPGGGKGVFTARLAADVSRCATVILIAPENKSETSIRPRLEAAGANLDRVFIERDLLFPRDLDRLEQLVIEKRARLVVIDPISASLDFNGPRRVSRFGDSIRVIAGPLDEMAERHHFAGVITEHILKNVNPRAHLLQAIPGGSSGLAAAAQMVYVIGRDPADEERVLLVSAKSNAREDPVPFAFRLDSVSYAEASGETGTAGVLTPLGEVDFPDPISMLLRPRDSESKSGPAPDKLARASEWLTGYLYASGGHERPANEIEEDGRLQGISKGTLTRAKKTIGVESVQRNRVWYWRLPQELVDALDAEEGEDDE